MPAVFVHGVPDTARVWKPVLARLSRQDVAALSLPGFGRPTGDGFDATKDAYARWLLDELAALPTPRMVRRSRPHHRARPRALGRK